MSLLVDGFTAGLAAAIWTLGAVLAIAIVAGCVAGGLWLLSNAYDALGTTRPAWWLRARRSIRRRDPRLRRPVGRPH